MRGLGKDLTVEKENTARRIVEADLLEEMTKEETGVEIVQEKKVETKEERVMMVKLMTLQQRS